MQNPGIGAGISSGAVVSTKTALTASSPTFATVNGTSAQVIAANSNRKSLVFVNTSSSNISFGIGASAAVVGSGITLTPNGVWEADEYSYVTSAINAISSGSSSNLTIQEFT